MSDDPAASLADAALSFLGSPYRLHGRDPATGLDCAGLVQAALARVGRHIEIPCSYALRCRSTPDLAPLLKKARLTDAGHGSGSGDIVLLRPRPAQFHLAIATARGLYVHAHAGLRRVVHSPVPDGWTVAARWRLIP